MLLVDIPSLCNRFSGIISIEACYRFNRVLLNYGIISIEACYGINRVLLNYANLSNTKEDHTKACSNIKLGQKPK